MTVTLTTVSPGAGTPTGQVQLFDGKKKLATAVLSNGSAVFQVSFSSAGQRVLRAVYAGDTNFSGSEGTDTHTVS